MLTYVIPDAVLQVLLMEVGQRESLEEIKEFMASNGYVFQKHISLAWTNDFLFTHESVKIRLPGPMFINKIAR